MDNDLPIAPFRLQIRALTPIRFNHYSGSAWRGLFGHQLKNAVCVTRMSDCKECALYRRCPYSYLFETPPPENTRFMRRSNAAPHPFVLSPDPALRQLAEGEQTSLALTLIGDAAKQLPYFVHAFQRAGARGVGVGDGRFELAGVEQEAVPGSGQWEAIMHDGGLSPMSPAVPQVPAVPDRVTMALHSPLRLKHRDRFLSPRYFPFSGVVANLLRRYSMTSYFHNDTVVEMDFRDWVERASAVEHENAELRWFRWNRYSSRQHKKIGMDGIVGHVTFDGEAIAPFWPLLWLGQWLHLGKGTSMGLGRYRIGPAA